MCLCKYTDSGFLWGKKCPYLWDLLPAITTNLFLIYKKGQAGASVEEEKESQLLFLLLPSTRGFFLSLLRNYIITAHNFCAWAWTRRALCTSTANPWTHRQLCKLTFIQKLVIHKQLAAVGLPASYEPSTSRISKGNDPIYPSKAWGYDTLAQGWPKLGEDKSWCVGSCFVLLQTPGASSWQLWSIHSASGLSRYSSFQLSNVLFSLHS